MYIFVYGTLRDEALDDKVLEHVPILFAKDWLQNWKKIYKGKGYYTIEPIPGSIVSGDLVEVDQEDMEKLDDWEDLYVRTAVTTLSGVDCFAYILKGNVI